MKVYVDTENMFIEKFNTLTGFYIRKYLDSADVIEDLTDENADLLSEVFKILEDDEAYRVIDDDLSY